MSEELLLSEEAVMAYEKILTRFPDVEKLDHEKVAMVLNTLAKFAPDVAIDPLMAKSFVTKVIEMSGDDLYVDIQTILTLTKIQYNYDRTRDIGLE